MSDSYKILTNTDYSGNSIENVSQIVGNEYTAEQIGELGLDRNLLITTKDATEGNAGNLLLRSGTVTGEGLTSGYVHIWSGSKKELTDGIQVNPDKSIVENGSTIHAKSTVSTTVESKADTYVKVTDGTESHYTKSSLTDKTTTYGLNATDATATIGNKLTATAKNIDVHATTDYASNNTPSAPTASLAVTGADSSLTIRKIHSSERIDALDVNASGDVNIVNRFTDGVEKAVKYDRNLTVKDAITDVESDGIQLHVHGKADDVFRLVAFGSQKPTIDGETVTEPTDYSKLTIQNVDVLNSLNFKGTDLDLGRTDHTTDVAIDAKALTIKSKDTDEYHDIQNVYSGFTSTDYGADNVKDARYRLVVTNDNARLDLDDIYATNHIDSKGTLTVTGLTTLNGNLNIKDSIEAVNTAKSLDIKAEKYVIKSVTDSHDYITVDNTNKSIKLDSELITIEAGDVSGKTLTIKNGKDSGNKPVTSTTYKALVGDSYINVDSAEIDNETVGTSNIGTINNQTLLNVDGQVDIDSSDFALDSKGAVNVTTTAEATYAENHSGKYSVDANTYHIVANKDEDSTVTADNLKTNKTIKTNGILDVAGLSSLKGNVNLTGTDNKIYSENPIRISSDSIYLQAESVHGTGVANYATFLRKNVAKEGEQPEYRTVVDIYPQDFYLHKGDIKEYIISSKLDADGNRVVDINADNINATAFNTTSIGASDVEVSGKLHGKANIDFNNESASLTTKSSTVSTSGSHAETHSGTYSLKVQTDKTPSASERVYIDLGLTEDSKNKKATHLTMDETVVHLTGTTTLDGTKVNLNAPVEITETITLTDTPDTGKTADSLIKSDNKITIKSDDIELKSATGSNSVKLNNTDGLKSLALNKLHITSGTIDIDSHHTKGKTTETYISADHLNATDVSANDVQSASGTISTLGATSLTTTNLTTSGDVELNATKLNSTATEATIKQQTSSVYLGYTAESEGVPTSPIFKLSTAEGKMDFKGTTGLTGTLTVSNNIQADGGVTTNNIHGIVPQDKQDTELTVDAKNLKLTQTDGSLTMTSATVDMKLGTFSVLDEGNKEKGSTMKATHVEANTIGAVKEVESIKATNLDVSNTLNVNGLTVYWDNSTNSLVFGKNIGN